ncbi:MAG: 6-phospho-3-hexuloisomerase, partial [Candidatus Hadarchaeales archaeon]
QNIEIMALNFFTPFCRCNRIKGCYSVAKYFSEKVAAERIVREMEEMQPAMKEILAFLNELPNKIDGREAEKFCNAILKAKRIFAVGAGRSGLVIKAFVMRLMHLDLDVYVIGETITPALRPGDLLVALSGSGETDLIVESARIAKKIGAKIAALTSYPRSRLGRLSDIVVTIPGRTKIAKTKVFMSRELSGEYAPLTPLGTLFEIGSMVFLDSVVAALMKKLGRNEEEMRARHATIE